MRLNKTEREIIKNTVKNLDGKAKIYLFGSRVDNKKKGGDIDLLVISSKLNFSHKLKILRLLYEKLGEQRIDLVIKENIKTDPFVKTIIESAAEL